MILGQDVWQDVNAAKREIGVMPQPDQIFDRLTGMQLLIYSGMLRGMKRDVAHSRAGDLLNAFDLVSAAGHDGVRLFRGHDQEDLPGVRDDSQPAHPGA